MPFKSIFAQINLFIKIFNRYPFIFYTILSPGYQLLLDCSPFKIYSHILPSLIPPSLLLWLKQYLSLYWRFSRTCHPQICLFGIRIILRNCRYWRSSENRYRSCPLIREIYIRKGASTRKRAVSRENFSPQWRGSPCLPNSSSSHLPLNCHPTLKP